MNPDWKFIRQDAAGAENPAFDDARWETVSTPHTYNDVDTFDQIITRSGEADEYMGVAWYRKRFKIPARYAGGKAFVEFEGMRQAGRFFLNGKPLGKFENGVTACGVDISEAAYYGDRENVLAVKVDNSRNYVEEATGIGYEWQSKDFNPSYGGLNRNVRLHLAGKVYQTLPLYENLRTSGVYVHARNISPSAHTAEIIVDSEVCNETNAPQNVELSVVVADTSGAARLRFRGRPETLTPGQTRVLNASGLLTNARLWDDRAPNLYDVYTLLTINGKVVDMCRTLTGFRKAEFRGGAGKGGLYLNDRFVYLKGYAQRATDEWAGLGAAYPNWMHDYSASLVRASRANYIRWMHTTPTRQDVSACDRFGIVEIAPAGDKEKDAEGRQWEQRVEVMRASMIYLRNAPSILFWEAGNNGVSAAHMKQMRELRLKWDPDGGRAMGCRSIQEESAVAEAEYFGTMVSMDPRIYRLKDYTDTFRGYSDARRDKAPLLEAEDYRDEAARRFWDDYSPPSFGFHKKPQDTYDLNSETYCLGAINRYNAYYAERISNPDPKHSKWTGYASIIFADTNSHGRQYGSEVCRVSGKVDAVRLPKESYYAFRVMQNEQPDIHIIGHWTYPAKTKKTMYVVSNCPSVELFLNGKSLGVAAQPTDGYLFAFPDVTWQAGVLQAVGMRDGKAECRHELRTVGSPKHLRLTPIVGSEGLAANGSDVALFDVEVVDANGQRCPTEETRVDFALQGPALWRGGYNSGRPGSTNNTYLDTECGINRVAVRSTLIAGSIILTATAKGLEQAMAQITSHSVPIVNGLTETMPSRLAAPRLP